MGQIIREADWKEPLSEEWLQQNGFVQDGEKDAWCLWNESLPLFVMRCDETVWQAELDGTTWPVDIRVRGQIRDLCRAIEEPLEEDRDGLHLNKHECARLANALDGLSVTRFCDSSKTDLLGVFLSMLLKAIE